jgi:hypothetical protein
MTEVKLIQILSKTKIILIIGVTILIALNFFTFLVAYPETYTPSPGITASGSILAKDFSAYYVGAWRLWYNPSQIYHFGALGGAEPVTSPYPEAYKYLPSFLLVVSPLLSLNYQQALMAFDVIQFMILPAMAYMLYKLLGSKHLAVTFTVLAIALLLPFPTQNWGMSPSYYWQWGEGQAKVFVTFLLLLSFYLGIKNRSYLSGIVFAFGFFDVRFGLLAFPLFLMYNRKKLKAALTSAVSALVISNLMLLYPGMGSGFISMVLNTGITTPLYYYALIPFFTLTALIVVNFKELVATFDYKGAFTNYTGAQKHQER